VATLLRGIREETHALANNEALRKLLQDEQTWLSRAERTVSSIRHHREWEVHRFWPAVWRRWAVAATFVMLAAAAAGAGYAGIARPYETELATLRARVEFLDAVARRVLMMTPTERRRFDADEGDVCRSGEVRGLLACELLEPAIVEYVRCSRVKASLRGAARLARHRLRAGRIRFIAGCGIEDAAAMTAACWNGKKGRAVVENRKTSHPRFNEVAPSRLSSSRPK
jgi:hypothetical protein